MALVSGPGRGGMPAGSEPIQDTYLVVEKHVNYIKSLDTVRRTAHIPKYVIDDMARGKTNWSTGSQNIYD